MVDEIVDFCARISRNLNIYTKFFQKDDMKEYEEPSVEVKGKYTAKYNIYETQNSYMVKFGYKIDYNTYEKFTLYTPKKNKNNCVLYVPGFGRNFTIMNLNSEFNKYDIDLVGIDLPNYGYSYRKKAKNVNYNTTDDIDEYFKAIYVAIGKCKTNGYQKVILMGNSTGGLICANYILNPRYFEKKPDFLVLESPLLEFKKLSTFVARPISQILYSIVPDLILSRDGDDPDWLRDNSFFKDSDVPPVNKGKVDYWYNPLSRKPLYVSYLYNCLKMINNIASVKEKVNIPILLFYNPSYDPHINVKVVEDRVRKMTNNPNIYTRVDFNHEIMLDSWHNINYCIRQIGDFVKKPQKAPDKKQKNKN